MQAENQTEWELTEMLTAKELLGRAQALEPQLVEWRRTLHRHPEVGFDLTQTKALVKKALTEMGYEPKDCARPVSLRWQAAKSPARPSCCGAIWMPCPFRRNPAWITLPRCQARCTAAATICTRQ